MPFYDAYEVVVHYSLPDAEQAVNIFHVLGDTALLEGGADALNTIFTDAYNAHLKALQHPSVRFDQLTITDLNTDTGLQKVYVHGIAGTAGGQPMPNQIAALISWKTAYRTRNYRGRSYIAGFTESNSDGNYMNETVRSGLSAYALQLETNLPATLGVLSRKTGLGRPITGHSVNTNWKTMRRRTAGH
jgi:hypothetical protein